MDIEKRLEKIVEKIKSDDDIDTKECIKEIALLFSEDFKDAILKANKKNDSLVEALSEIIGVIGGEISALKAHCLVSNLETSKCFDLLKEY